MKRLKWLRIALKRKVLPPIKQEYPEDVEQAVNTLVQAAVMAGWNIMLY